MSHACPIALAAFRLRLRLCLASLLLGFTAFSQAQYVTFMDYHVGTGRVYGITTGPDGAMWWAWGNVLGRITTAGTIASYQVAAAFPAGIAAGPDGALWFTAVGKPSQIGRITTAGVITLYPISTSDVFSTNDWSPQNITAGPDGALWFTERDGNRIGRITTTGKLSEYPLSKPDSKPANITPGPDGALWFAEAAMIGRITSAGAITEYSVPSKPTGITAGPDGAVWFTEPLANRIGRISTAGTIREFAIPTPNSYPYSITAGTDGALWFTESYVRNIGRISADGTITEYSAPSPGTLLITTGPDGALWFTTGSIEDDIWRAVLDLTSGSLAQVVSGGLWKTTFTIVNTGATTAGVSLSFFNDNGDPLVLPITSPQLPGSLQTSTGALPILPHATIVLETELPEGQPMLQGWAQFVANSRAVSAFATFRQNSDSGPQEAVVPLETRNGSYVLSFDDTNFGTGVALANPAPIPVSIPVAIRDELGTLLGTDIIMLPPHGHTAFTLSDPSRPVIAQGTASRRGMVEFSRPPSGQISVLGLRFCPTGAFTTIPVMMK